jgi:microcystin-dependent protein
MPISQYLPFANGGVPGSPNTLSYSSWLALTTLRGNGFQTGVADATQVNTALRQTSVAAAGLALFAANNGSLDVLDDSSVENFAAALKSAIDLLTARPGDIKASISPLEQPGWRSANGQALSRTTFAALFAVIGTTYGAGDGSTTFNVPDLRGEFLRGWDNGRGVDSGRVIGTLQPDMLKAHVHNIGTTAVDENGPLVANASAPTSTTASTESTGGTETRPRNIAVHYLIKT